MIRRHHGAVYGYLRRLGADRSLAEDLTQETYARAWSRIATLRRSASLRSWLLTIARNEFLQWHRASRCRPSDLPDGAETAAQPGAETGLLVDERDRELRWAVAVLEPELQEAVALHYFQGLSFRESGAVIGIPAGTVKSRIHRALGRLRVTLESKEARHETERAGTATARDS
jgi:RNA polymerase sigma-70 factor (ECF subfamily)